MPTNGKYFYQGLLKSKKKTGANHAFFRDNCASIWRKTLNGHLLENDKKLFFPQISQCTRELAQMQ